ncbi:MAG: isoprenylcysteine carboxylmethyltransferase family protein [Acidobacteriota bacterium]
MKPLWRLAFRPAPERPAAVHLAWTALQTFLFWGFFLALCPWLIVRLESSSGLPRFALPGPPGWPWGLFALAGSLGLWSGYTMSRRGRGTPLPPLAPARLVVAGPYRWLRNPMVVAGLAQGVAVALALGSWSVLVYALAGAPVWHFLVRPFEERDLAERFGSEYERYRRRVPLWWPRWPAVERPGE